MVSERSRLIRGPLAPLRHRGDGQRLGGGVHVEDGALGPALLHLGHRQAHAGTGDGGADIDGGRLVVGRDAEGAHLIVHFQIDDLAEIRDDASEHGSVRAGLRRNEWGRAACPRSSSTGIETPLYHHPPPTAAKTGRRSEPPQPHETVAAQLRALHHRKAHRLGEAREGTAASASRAPAPSAPGERSTATSSTSPSSSSAAATCGPPSTIRRVTPRRPRSFITAGRSRRRRQRGGRAALNTRIHQRLLALGRGVLGGDGPHRHLLRRTHQAAGGRQAQVAVEHDPHRRAPVHAGQADGQLRIVRENGADADHDGVRVRTHEMDAGARFLAGDGGRARAFKARLPSAETAILRNTWGRPRVTRLIWPA